MSWRARSLFAALILAAVHPAHAQQAEKIRVVGFLSPAAAPSARHEAFRQELRALGWVEGQNLRIEFRWAANSADRLAAMAEELVRLKVDVLVAQSTPAVEAAKNATRTIPIVMGAAADPVGSGFVASLARPGGNITGVSMMMPELAGKRLELLRDLVPRLKRVAFLAHGGDSAHKLFVQQTQDAGRTLGVQVQVLVVERAEEFEGAFSAMAKERVDALVIQPLFINTLQLGPRLAELAAKNRLPTICDGVGFAEQGGLLYYGPDTRAVYPRVAVYVDRILRGAKPAELPVEQPQKFELVINLKTAQRLGLGVPRSVLLRADRVIE
jgi:putative ABC transport system substrate-binding protein